MVTYERWLLRRRFTNSSLTDEEPIRFWVGGHLREGVTYERWSLTRGGRTGRFHCSYIIILKHLLPRISEMILIILFPLEYCSN